MRVVGGEPNDSQRRRYDSSTSAAEKGGSGKVVKTITYSANRRVRRLHLVPLAGTVPADLLVREADGFGCTTSLWCAPQAACVARRSQKSSKRPLRMQQRRAMMALAPATVQRMPARLNRAPICLQPASTTPEEMHQALGAELRIAQAVSVPEHIVNAPSRLWRGLGLGAQRGDHGAEPAGIQLGTPVPDPLVGQVCAGAVDGLGHVAQMLLRVVDVDDSMAPGNCSSATRQIQGAPSPMTTPPGRGVEAAPLRLAIGTLGTAAL